MPAGKRAHSSGRRTDATSARKGGKSLLYDMVVIGASAGGVPALCALLANLPADYPGSVFVVMHIGAQSALSEILFRVSALKVTQAVNNELIEHGHVYIAPPQQHMTVETDASPFLAGTGKTGIGQQSIRSFAARRESIVRARSA